MTQLPFHAAMVVFTMVLFVATLALNEWLFSGLEFVKGINWIYLPAGVRLLSTLLFGASGISTPNTFAFFIASTAAVP